jgi:ATP-dependent DNA helicase RecQ
VAAERAREQQAMLEYAATSGCRMEYLRRQLDDPAAAPCGRCDNCTGRKWSAAVPEATQAAAREHLLRPGVEIQPRKMWPAGMRELGIDVAGKISQDLAAEPGRAVGRLTDLGWGARLRALVADPQPAGSDAAEAVPADGDVPEDMLAAVVKVLAAWDWADRPGGVVAMPSATRPQLIAGLAARIAAIGRMPYLGELTYTRPGRPGRQHNSAQRLRTVWGSLAVPGSLQAELDRLTTPVLLVDDRIDSGWTMTVGAMVLREAGAPAVLPLALATATAT